MQRKNQDWDNIPGFDREKEQYVQLDLDHWLEKYGVEEEARKCGAKNQPSADADGPDGTESRILAWINRRGRICRGNVSSHLSDLQRNLTDKEDSEELTILEQGVRQIVGDAEIALESKVAQGRNALTGKEEDVRVGYRDFAAFRQRSGLTRLADYSHRQKARIYILSMFILEVGLNATLLMEVNAFGLLGSIGQMGLIGAVNVLIAGAAMGALLCERHHIALSRKIFSWLGIVLIVAVVVFFNLVVGHFRDSMQAVLSDPSADIFALGSDTFQRFLAGWASLSFQSYLLVLLGILCFSVASWKWRQRDDIYPDYGRRDRELKKVQADYVKEFDRVNDDLQKTYQQYKSQLEDIRYQLEIKQSQWRNICLQGKHLVVDYTTNLEQYQHDLDFLLNRYRTANRNARTDPAPPHFEKPERVDASILEPPAFNPPAETSLKGVMDQVHTAISRLQDVFRNSMRKYPTLEAVMASRPDTIK